MIVRYKGYVVQPIGNGNALMVWCERNEKIHHTNDLEKALTWVDRVTRGSRS